MQNCAKIRVASVAIGLVVSSYSALVYADTSNSASTEAVVGNDDSGLAEIVVTANKREESINNVGLTIQAIGGKELEQRGLQSLQDLATAVPGLVYSQTESSTPVYTLRGVGFYDTSLASYPDVSVYVDQMPLPFPTLTTLAIFDLERVEVLKGPQGILFGNNATGGAINYIAAKPTKELSAGTDLTYGRFSTVQANGFVSGPVASNLLARVSFNYTKGDGYQISASRPGDTNGAPNRLAGRILLDWTPNDSTRFELNINGWYDKTQPTAAQYVIYKPSFVPLPLNGPFVPNAVNNDRVADWSSDTRPSADNRLQQISLRGDYDLSAAVALTSLSTYIHYIHDQVPEGDGLPQHRQDLLYNLGNINSLFQEFRLANNKSDAFRWLAGVNYSNDRVFENDFVGFRDGTAANKFTGWSGNAFYAHQEMKTYAGFMNGEYSAGPVTFVAGSRYTQSRRSTDNCVYAPYNPAFDTANNPEPAFFTGLSNFLTGAHQPVPGPYQCFNILPTTLLQGAYRAQFNQNNVSWRGGVDWHLSADDLAYVNVTKGFKAGGFPTLSGSGTSFTPVTQESVLSYEGGIKSQMFDKHLSLNFAAFYYKYEDKQLKSKLVDIIFGPVDALVNIPRSNIKGAELEMQARPFKGLTLGAAVTYLNAHIQQFTGVAINGATSNFNGTRVPYTPAWQLAGNFNYDFPISGTTTGFIGGQVTRRTATNSSVGYPPLFTIPAYTLLDLQGGVDFEGGRYRAKLWGKNVTDEFYVTTVISGQDGVARYAGFPATYGVTFSARF
jgi:iron complex outermembrane receptor protein